MARKLLLVTGPGIKALVKRLVARGMTPALLHDKLANGGSDLTHDEVQRLYRGRGIAADDLLQIYRCLPPWSKTPKIYQAIVEELVPDPGRQIARAIVDACLHHGWGYEAFAKHVQRIGKGRTLMVPALRAASRGEPIPQALAAPLADVLGLPVTEVRLATVCGDERAAKTSAEYNRLPLSAVIIMALAKMKTRIGRKGQSGVSTGEFATANHFSSRRLLALCDGGKIDVRRGFLERLGKSLGYQPPVIVAAMERQVAVAPKTPLLVQKTRQWMDRVASGSISRAAKQIGFHPDTLSRFLDDGDISQMQNAKRELLRQALGIPPAEFYPGISIGGQFTKGSLDAHGANSYEGRLLGLWRSTTQLPYGGIHVRREVFALLEAALKKSGPGARRNRWK